MAQIELKKGTNFIIGGKAFTAEELVGLLRKGIITVILIGLPMAFAGGYFFAKSTIQPEVQVFVPQKS